jgi:hypothetical protein
MTLGVVGEDVALELAVLVKHCNVELALGHIDADPALNAPIHRIGPSSYAGSAANTSKLSH